jgi:hypothetical protein
MGLAEILRDLRLAGEVRESHRVLRGTLTSIVTPDYWVTVSVPTMVGWIWQ